MIVYDPLRASSYIDLPMKLKARNACVNVQNVDQKCFLWSVLSCLHPISDNAEYCSHYTAFENELNMTDITYPVELKQISKF